MNYPFTKVSVRPGTVRQALLLFLQESPKTLQELSEHVKHRSSWVETDKFYAHTWELVVRSGYAELVDDKYVITEAGAAMLEPTPTRLEKVFKEKIEEQIKSTSKVKANLFVQANEVYKCPELGKTCDRAGAYDFQKFPSLINGKRVYAS